MNFFEKTMMKISLILRKLSIKLKDFAMGLYTQRMIDQQLPPHRWPEHEPWGNFQTREGEHEHV